LAVSFFPLGAECVFWAAFLVVCYTYLGYPAIIWVLARYLPHPIRSFPRIKTVTVVIAAHNEQRHIAEKIENCLALDYPQEYLDVLVVSDGSTDRTNEIVARYAARYAARVALIALPERRGKAHALNIGAAAAAGEILLLADVRQRFDRQVARALVRNFADPEVGAVSGELILLEEEEQEQPEGLGLYWQYEKAIRQAESRSGSTVGYTGAISAIRRILFLPLPDDTLVDDLVTPLQVAAQGYRVVFEPSARAFDQVSTTPGHEFARKVRTLAGVTQTLLRLRQLAGPLSFRLRWQFWSHKVMRLLAPYALASAFGASMALDSFFYRAAFFMQMILYMLGVLGMVGKLRGSWARLTATPRTFLMLNMAAVTGAVRYLTGQRLDLWRQAPSK
jgi:cellulose synthase/poly-beta-1,6-N-acetylglucosamine synthase-like glycosyltransferase